MYEIVKSNNRIAGEESIVHRLTDHAWIPMNPANRDYQEYLEWVAEGNTALVIEADA